MNRSEVIEALTNFAVLYERLSNESEPLSYADGIHTGRAESYRDALKFVEQMKNESSDNAIVFTVNCRQTAVAADATLTYQSICRIAGYDPSRIYSVTCRSKGVACSVEPASPPFFAEPGMIISIADTSNA
jgi:hypothetical protein